MDSIDLWTVNNKPEDSSRYIHAVDDVSVFESFPGSQCVFYWTDKIKT